MVQDTLAGDRIIGMVLLRDLPDRVTADVPPVYDIGCSGLITHCEPLDRGRFNIVLRGLDRFRILREDRTRAYRRATVERLADEVGGQSDDDLRAARHGLELVLENRMRTRGSESKIPPDMADGDLVNTLSQYLELEPVEKQALLERSGLFERCQSLVDLLEMKLLVDSGNFPQMTVQ